MSRRTSYFLLKQGLREVVSLWKQFLAIIAIGAIAVTLFVGLQANADSLENRVNAVYEAGNLADSYVTVNPMKGPQSDFSDIKYLLEGEADVEGRFYAFSYLNSHNSYCAISEDYPTISKASNIIAGGEEATKGDFFVVDTHLSTTKERKEGDENSNLCRVGEPAQIEFDLSAYVSSGLVNDDFIEQVKLDKHLLPGVELSDTPLKKAFITLEIPVTGIMDHPENVLLSTYSVSVFLLSSSAFAKAFDAYLGKFFDEDGIDLFYTALSFSMLGWEREVEGRFPIANQFLIKGKGNFDVEKANDKIEALFDAKSEKDSNLMMIQRREDTSFASTMQMDVVQARQFTYVFPFVFFAVAILVILTTMSQLILKERTQIGTLKAMGLNRGGIARYYGAITSIVVGIGILIGEIIGPLIIPLILDNKYRILYSIPRTTYVFPVLAGVLTAVIFLVLANAVTFLTVRKEASLLPVESMRPATRSFKSSKRIENIIPSKTRFASLMALRNIRENLVKSMMLILGVMGCTALLCCGFGIDDTIDFGVRSDPVINNQSDVSLTLTGSIKSEKMIADLQGILEDNRIKQIQGSIRNNAEIRHEDKSVNSFYNVYGPVVNLMNEEPYDFLPFSWNADEVLLSKKIADRIGAKVGDEVSFSIGNRNLEAKVGKILDIFYSNGVYISSNSPALEGENYESFSSYFACFEKYSEDIGKDIGKISYVGNVMTSQGYKTTLQSILSSVSSMTNAIKIFAILLAIVVLYNISILNFRERSRDIATMKVLGFNKIEIANSLLFETMFLTFVGVILGLFAGWPFLFAVLFMNQVEVVSYMYVIYPLSFLYAFLLTFVVSLAFNLYLSSRTGKVKMVESLKSVE